MEKFFFDQPVKSYIKTYENIRKITNSQRDDYTAGCLLDYNYFKKHKMIAIDLIKQQALDANQKAIQQVNIIGNLDRANNRIIFFIIEEMKETNSDFLQGPVKVL